MRVEIRHQFEGATRREIEELYLLDDDFNCAVFAQLGFDRRVLHRTLRGESLERVLRLCPRRPLPPPFSLLVPSGVFHITEAIHYDLGTHRGTWRTVPSVLGSQFLAEGSLAIDETDAAVVFRLEGTARASIPLLGSRAERQAVSTAQTQHAALARAVRERLAASQQATSFAFLSA